jgi:hypothetical protein
MTAKRRPKRKAAAKPVKTPRAGRRRRAASDPRTVAVAYLDAFGKKRFDRLADLLHPDVEFKGPGGSLHNARDLIASLRKLAPVLLRTDLKRVFVERDEALVRYDFVTDTPVGPVPIVEMLKIENGRVRSIWLLFDRQVWNAVLAAWSTRAEGL